MTNPDLVPILETERLLLRGHRTDDFAECAAMWADPQVTALISGTPSSAEQSWSRLLRYSGHWYQLGYGYWVVESRATGEFIGEVGFVDYRREIVPALTGPEAGRVIRSNAHGMGYATEAVTRMIDWADVNLAFPRTVCIMDPSHTASLRVAVKAGFTSESMGCYAGRDTRILARVRKEHSNASNVE